MQVTLKLTPSDIKTLLSLYTHVDFFLCNIVSSAVIEYKNVVGLDSQTDLTFGSDEVKILAEHYPDGIKISSSYVYRFNSKLASSIFDVTKTVVKRRFEAELISRDNPHFEDFLQRNFIHGPRWTPIFRMCPVVCVMRPH